MLVSYRPLAWRTKTPLILLHNNVPSRTDGTVVDVHSLDAIDAIFALPPDLPVLAERDDRVRAQVRAVDEVDVLGLLTVGVIRPEAAVDEPLLRERVDGVIHFVHARERLLVLVPDKLNGVGFLPTAERLQAAVAYDAQFYHACRFVARVFDDVELVELIERGALSLVVSSPCVLSSRPKRRRDGRDEHRA